MATSATGRVLAGVAGWSLLLASCASLPATGARDPSWAARLEALSRLLAVGPADLTPQQVAAAWPEPLETHEELAGTRAECKGEIRQEAEWVYDHALGELPIRGSEFVFELHPGEPGGSCRTRLRLLRVVDYRRTLREAKQAGDELTRAGWPTQLPYPERPSGEYDPRWYRAAEWEGWLKDLNYYFGAYPPTMGGVNVQLSKLPSGWQLSASFSAGYVDVW